MSELSQEEIDALVNGTATATQNEAEEDDQAEQIFEELDTAAQEDVTAYFTPEQIDALGEIGNICMGTSARRCTRCSAEGCPSRHRRSDSTRRKTPLRVQVAAPGDQRGVHAGVFGKNLLIIKDYDAAVITDLLMGGEGQIEKGNIVLNEIHLSAMSEVMNQMIGSAATAMANMMDRDVNISPPQVQQATADDDASKSSTARRSSSRSASTWRSRAPPEQTDAIMSVEMAEAMIDSLMPSETNDPESAR